MYIKKAAYITDNGEFCAFLRINRFCIDLVADIPPRYNVHFTPIEVSWLFRTLSLHIQIVVIRIGINYDFAKEFNPY